MARVLVTPCRDFLHHLPEVLGLPSKRAAMDKRDKGENIYRLTITAGVNTNMWSHIQIFISKFLT